MTRLLFLAPALLLTACATAAAEQPQVVGSGGECRNDGLAQFTGQLATAEVGAEILRVSGARTLQWIEHGMMVTMEFNSSRVRVQLDASNRVESARCG
ncbi:I78 family peptidase inhibitor [Sphingomonas arenae]|uniref:I78 family peptidase inhibitor n=1 Tax=Sphingomonas arenae TaxID=2812555 RepID=UPI0019677645|nr:I78 family peptidase inhibitor [Sphingomonas arenae]